MYLNVNLYESDIYIKYIAVSSRVAVRPRGPRARRRRCGLTVMAQFKA